jgi:hypothetical protein
VALGSSHLLSTPSTPLLRQGLRQVNDLSFPRPTQSPIQEDDVVVVVVVVVAILELGSPMN